MEAMRLPIFLLLAVSSPALAAPLREFHLVTQPKNWTEAQSYCRENFFDLVSMESAADWARVREVLANSAQPTAWIGLFDDVRSWRWVLDNTSLYDQDLGHWFSFNVKNAATTDHCGRIYQGKLTDLNCQLPKRSVCYDESSNSYIGVTVRSTWEASRSHCRQTYTDLASIRSQQELQDVMAVMDMAYVHWIGLTREGWKWSDQSQSSFRLWLSSEPSGGNETCGAAHVDGWSDESCHLTHPFICSAPRRKVLKVVLKTDGSVNVKDPLLQEAVVKQMERGLGGQGIHRELRMRWRRQLHGDVFSKKEMVLPPPPDDAASKC